MRIGEFQPITYNPQLLQRRAMEATREQPVTAVDQGPSLSEQITDAVQNVNTLQNQANELTEQVASGNTDDTHKAIIATEHAMLALDFTLQIRNKVLEAYQEIMRTQI